MSDPYRFEDDLRDEIQELRERLALIHGLVTAEPLPTSISNEDMLAKIAALSRPEDEGGEKMTLAEYDEWRRYGRNSKDSL